MQYFLKISFFIENIYIIFNYIENCLNLFLTGERFFCYTITLLFSIVFCSYDTQFLKSLKQYLDKIYVQHATAKRNGEHRGHNM